MSSATKDNTASVKLFIKSLSNAISSYTTALTPLQHKSLSDLLTQLTAQSSDSSAAASAKDQITVLNNVAYVIISTLFAYLKTIGVDTETHPIKKELARVRESMQRMKALSDPLAAEHQEKKEAKEQEKKKEYLNRVIGVKGSVASAGAGMSGPAISSKSFSGVHTRFEEELIENLPDLLSESDAKGGISKDRTKKVAKKTKSKGKVTKPKKGKK
ncbi:Exosome complex protein LRP1 [Candida viswanathii]|uniref:Exosome complex protein n=1 Tax=Candida viswanathii TaxID=5486 RepID=A0A367XPV0_9ASCO|nr:Exosome complex protein LRP1 [Candida viswanathii]